MRRVVLLLGWQGHKRGEEVDLGDEIASSLVWDHVAKEIFPSKEETCPKRGQARISLHNQRSHPAVWLEYIINVERTNATNTQEVIRVSLQKIILLL